MIATRGLDAMDARIAAWMDQHGRFLLRISLAIVFIWFGLLKPFGLSPAEELVKNTVYWIPADVFVPILGWWEVAIGVVMLFRPLLRAAIFLLFLQMPGTALPLVLLPEVCFAEFPYAHTRRTIHRQESDPDRRGDRRRRDGASKARLSGSLL